MAAEPSEVPSEVLRDFSPAKRVAVGIAIYGLADRLAGLSAVEIASLGVAITGQASGWMPPDEVGHPMTVAEVDDKAAVLWERLAAARAWDDQLEDPPR